jgi:iron(III) transport system ATP-binding protein
MSAPSLQVSNIALSFGPTRVLRDVSLVVEGGTTLALLGPSGCGKTSLLRLIAGLQTPDAGRIDVGGVALVDEHTFVAPERRRIGMVFQDGALFPHMTVAENVAYGLTKSEVAQGRVHEALAMVDLAGFEDRRPGGLSGGQAQRVAVARAIAPRPDVLLLDEPFSSLDAELRVRVRSDLVRLLADLHVTTLFVTHDQEEAFVVGNQVAVMNNGAIVQQGTPAEIYETPDDRWLAGFVGDANLLNASPHGGSALTSIGVLPTLTPLQTTGNVMVRPEYLSIEKGTSATVRAVEFYGHDTSYEIEGLGEPILVRELRAPRFAVGDRVAVSYTGGPAVVFADDSNPE